MINDWNDQYSPQKTIKWIPRIDSLNDDAELSPTEVAKRSPTKSPRKRDKKLIEQRKLFDSKKQALAQAFLTELDQTITDGRLSILASSTGGVRIVWSKKLNSTAGRANWKRETIRSRSEDGTTMSTIYHHHASIELAEKVIDDERKH